MILQAVFELCLGLPCSLTLTLTHSWKVELIICQIWGKLHAWSFIIHKIVKFETNLQTGGTYMNCVCLASIELVFCHPASPSMTSRWISRLPTKVIYRGQISWLFPGFFGWNFVNWDNSTAGKWYVAFSLGFFFFFFTISCESFWTLNTSNSH